MSHQLLFAPIPDTEGSELEVFQIPNNQAVEKVPVPSLP